MKDWLIALSIIGALVGGFFLGQPYWSRPDYYFYVTEIENRQEQTVAQLQAQVKIWDGGAFQTLNFKIDSVTNLEIILISNGVTQ